MNHSYEKYMKKCLSLARRGEGFVSPNPLVGAVVLDKNGNIAGLGWHKKCGEAHAEVNAIADAKNKGINIKGGTIFVNLEPCSHYGKTPPCADLIIKEGLKKVVAGTIDPNPRVDGGGIKKLQKAGIDVVTGVLEQECKKINEVFFKNQTEKLPFVAIKTATTMDGKTATKTGSSKWITSQNARAQVQKLRNKYDAILTGSGTVLADNPSLTCRKRGGRNPVRIIVDSNLKTPVDSMVYQNDGTKIYIAALKTAKIKDYGTNAEIIFCPEKSGKIDLPFLLKELYKKGICSILVEAGGILNGVFLKQKLVDKIYHFIAPKILGDNEAKSFVEGFSAINIDDSTQLKIESVKKFNPDILIEAYL